MSPIDLREGSARADLTRLEPRVRDEMQDAQRLVLDARRSHPAYEDGRFLAARDLTNEQAYALNRQADLASVRRGGVIRGLDVAGVAGSAVRVTAGTGLTPSGDLVTLPRTLTVALGQIPEVDRIELADGVVDVAEPTPNRRSGLYLLALRPLEHAAYPKTRYPTTIHGAPGIEDGEIVESTALVLYPFRFEGVSAPDLRARIARAIFLDDGGELPPDALSLALILLEGGVARWIDSWMVRREVASDDACSIGLEVRARSLREAQLYQHDAHLREVVDERRGSLRFAASQHFRCLPPVGRLPAAAIDPDVFTQAYFPPSMTVELSVVVDEELRALVEEALDHPPIDLVGGDEDVDHSTIRVLVPMRAEDLNRLRLQRIIPPKVVTLAPALLKLRPVLALRNLIARRPAPAPPPDLGGPERLEPAPLLGAWRQAIAAVPDQLLWFVRMPAITVAPAAVFDRAPVPPPPPDTPPTPGPGPSTERPPEPPPRDEPPREEPKPLVENKRLLDAKRLLKEGVKDRLKERAKEIEVDLPIPIDVLDPRPDVVVTPPVVVTPVDGVIRTFIQPRERPVVGGPGIFRRGGNT
jgi:hypothetical protein